MIDRDRRINDVKKIIYELLCICAWQIHACLVLAGEMVPLESHFSRQYAPFCLMDINLLESIRIHKEKRFIYVNMYIGKKKCQVNPRMKMNLFREINVKWRFPLLNKIQKGLVNWYIILMVYKNKKPFKNLYSLLYISLITDDVLCPFNSHI